MALQETDIKPMMEQLQIIVPKLSDLLQKDLDIMKFHKQCYNLQFRLAYTMEILHVLKTGNKEPFNVRDVTLENVLRDLMKIGYIPEVVSKDIFLERVTEDIGTSYDLYLWLLTNSQKVATRAYLADFVDPVDVPNEFADDPDLKKAVDTNKELTDIFWRTYKNFSNSEREVATSQEVVSDLREMFHEVGNLEKRTKDQKNQLQSITDSQALISLGKKFYEADSQRSKIAKEISLNADMVKHLERTLRDLKRLEKLRNLNVDTILSSLREATKTSKTLRDSSVKLERDKVGKLKIILDETVKSKIENEQLIQKAELLKIEIQDLTNQKIGLHSSKDDKLSAFRKQATGIANRKEILSEKVNYTRNKHMQLTELLKTKQMQIFNTVGGELYHGERLKEFIAELRGKSVEYKKKRAKLQYWTTEAALLHRTEDVLLAIDPSIKDSTLQHLSDADNQSTSITANSIEEAKQISKKLIPEIETARVIMSQIQTALKSARNEASDVLEKYEWHKEMFQNATKPVTTTIDNLKEEMQMKNDKIEILEQKWKNVTHELEKLDQVLSRLVDDVLEDTETYHDQLQEKRKILKDCIQDLIQMLAEEEDQQREKLLQIRIYKHLQQILTTKLNNN